MAVQDGATATAEEILKLYDDALSDINTEIQKIKYNFAKRYGIDNDKAAFFLTRAQEEENLKMLVKALENAPDDKAREDILEYIHRDGLSVRAYASRIERYEAVKTSIYARIKKLAVDETVMLGGMLKEAYKESYYGNIDDIAKGFDVGINFGILNDDAINEAVNAKWSGKRFSKRIWDNTDRLAKEAQNLIVKSLMSGESNTKTAQKLADRMQVEKFNATTLVRTETAHVHAMADLKAYEDLGIEKYRYIATLDYKTCPTCSPLDGQVFYRRDAREGRNYPVMHPRCRCVTVMHTDKGQDKRIARNPLTEKNELIDGNITYSQWIRDMPQSQRQALELARRKDTNRTADKLLHEKYKKLLGTKEVPKSFGDFQKMKYAEPDKWDELKRKYRENSVDKNKKSSIIEVGSGNNMLKVNTGGKRNERSLTQKQLDDVIDYAVKLGMPKGKIYYADYDCTAYGVAFDLLRIGTDVYPTSVKQKNPNCNVSMKGAVAHEIIGHRNAALKGLSQNDELLEEVQASLRAAKLAPELSQFERNMLARDGLYRLHQNGKRLRDVKSILHLEG